MIVESESPEGEAPLSAELMCFGNIFNVLVGSSDPVHYGKLLE